MNNRYRFLAVEDTPGVWTVKDTQHENWKMPEKAITLRVRKPVAEQMAKLLNQEWVKFLRKPR